MKTKIKWGGMANRKKEVSLTRILSWGIKNVQVSENNFKAYNTTHQNYILLRNELIPAQKNNSFSTSAKQREGYLENTYRPECDFSSDSKTLQNRSFSNSTSSFSDEALSTQSFSEELLSRSLWTACNKWCCPFVRASSPRLCSFIIFNPPWNIVIQL